MLGANVWRRALGVDRATVIEEIDSDDQVAWLVTHAAKSTVCALVCIAWRSVGSIISLVVADGRAGQGDPERVLRPAGRGALPRDPPVSADGAEWIGDAVKERCQERHALHRQFSGVPVGDRGLGRGPP